MRGGRGQLGLGFGEGDWCGGSLEEVGLRRLVISECGVDDVADFSEARGVVSG